MTIKVLIANFKFKQENGYPELRFSNGAVYSASFSDVILKV